MASLALSLFGPWQFTLDSEPAAALRSEKERALLAYLAVEAGRPHRREALAGLLWSEFSDEAAGANLRKALHRLRQTVGEAFLVITPKTIQLNLGPGFACDLADFHRLLAQVRDHRHRNPDTCQACQDWLRLAAGLYRGELLQGLTLPDAIAFDEWLAVKREQARLQALGALRRLAAFEERRGDFEQVQADARRQIALEPWHEPAHRQLMRALAATGQWAAALSQYEACRKALADELGVQPEKETIKLYEAIQANEEMPRPPAPRHNLPSPAAPVVGREAELARLRERLLDPAERLVTLVGEGDVGKTRLALQAVRDVADDFAEGAWFVPLASVAAEGEPQAEALARAVAAALGLTLIGEARPAAQVLEHLRARECLLLLDNSEGLLDESGVDWVAEILAGVPRVALLVTAREPLDLQAERVMRINRLSEH